MYDICYIINREIKTLIIMEIVTLFDKEKNLGLEEFEKFASYGLHFVDIVDGEVYTSSDYDLPEDFDAYALSLLN